MGMKSNARRDGDDWILNGSKHFISGPVHAGLRHRLRRNRRRREPSAGRESASPPSSSTSAPRASTSARARIASAIAATRPSSSASTMCGSSQRQILGEEGRGLELAGQWLTYGRIFVGASCCGKAERLMGLAAPPASSRYVSGNAMWARVAQGGNAIAVGPV